MSTINTASASVSTAGSNSIFKTDSRVTGLFSGLDTDTLVKGMTSVQQAKIDAVRQKQTRQEWYNEALTSVKDAVNEFMNTYLSAAGSGSMLRSASYAAFKTVTSSTSHAASVTASGSAEPGNITLQINRLARNASISSSGRISKDGTEISANNTATLESLSLATKLEFNSNGMISFAINGKTFNFSRDTTLQSMINTINNDETANVTIKYSRLSDAFTITSDTDGPGGKVKITNLQGNAFGTNSAFGIGEVSISSTGTSVSSSGISADGTGITLDDTTSLGALSFAKALKFDSSNNISFSINGKVFTFSKVTTLREMLDTINNDTTANVTMYYSQSADGFTILSDSGSDGSIIIKNLAGNAFGQNSAFGIAETAAMQGADSEAVINGVTVRRPTNEYTIDGISYTLNKVTQGTAEEQVTFTVERDYSATISTITKFIEAYNELYTKLKNLVSEEDFSADYPPLTDAQRSEMTTEQIAAWEKKAKSGLLRQNRDLLNLLSNLRNSFYSALGGVGKNATEIGLTSAGYYDSNAGQITLNEDKITKALKNDPNEIIKMFTYGGSNAPYSEQGLIYKLRNCMKTFTDNAADSMKTVKKQINSFGTEISELEDKLEKLADRYYLKFSRMETALARLNSQAAFISQLFQ